LMNKWFETKTLRDLPKLNFKVKTSVTYLRRID
jgi:hypothetical protein